ncbi:Spore germination GerAB [Acididesulfobacillus acetoxydans]|uniref:Spore germination GerAB n=1 Tax=Acididesulfobacillus acetoxydans TaxID=1561005 RepID=A0A8S0Y1M6_9FIRM|nr:endospore germination permease [Acididesulfobacillus acetoxydans]CAA7599665.1 Spore germination GerAB [Acididesulfobacillus acetoxydans]CEJ06217.1 Spore germination protein [Acididesulfobacillus acetoxydans]
MSGRQLFFLVFCTVLGSALYGLPNGLIYQGRQDAWLDVSAGLGFAVIIALVLYILGSRYPNRTLFQYGETILGKYLGKVIGLIFAIFFLMVAAVLLRIEVDFLVVALMPETPPLVFALAFMAVSTYAVTSGVEVIGRLGELIGPLLILAVVGILFFTFNIIHLENLLPFFQENPAEVIGHSLLPGGWLGFVIIAGVLMAFQNEPRQALKPILGGTLTAALLIILVLFQCITILGVNVSIQQIYPLFRAVRMIEIGDFFERLDSMAGIVWTAGGFLAIVAFHECAAIGAAQLFKIKGNGGKWVALVEGLAILLLGLFIFHGSADRWQFLRSVFPLLALAVEMLIPMLLLTISVCRHGWGFLGQRSGGK